MSAPVYLDHAATTPVAPEVRAAMLPFLGEVFGNPSSAHATGRAARAAVDEARERVAGARGGAAGAPRCPPPELVSPWGGSGAKTPATRGVPARHADRGRHLVVTAIE